MSDFVNWSELKQSINQKENKILVNEREICFVHLGRNIGFEQNGKNEQFERPVLVFKKFGTRSFMAIPLTSKSKRGKFYFPFQLNNKDSVAILSQIRLLDTKRIIRKIGYISGKDFLNLKIKVRELLNL